MVKFSGSRNYPIMAFLDDLKWNLKNSNAQESEWPLMSIFALEGNALDWFLSERRGRVISSEYSFEFFCEDFEKKYFDALGNTNALFDLFTSKCDPKLSAVEAWE
jgi:hypothetical protein